MFEMKCLCCWNHHTILHSSENKTSTSTQLNCD